MNLEIQQKLERVREITSQMAALESELAEILGDGKPKVVRKKRAYGRPAPEIVLEYMRTLASPVTVKEVQVGLHAHARVDMPHGTVSYAISKMVADGWIETKDGTTYTAVKPVSSSNPRGIRVQLPLEDAD
jgi:hypothetical protein